MRRPRLAPLALAAGLAGTAATAAAQDTGVGVRPYRFTLQGYLVQSRFDGAAVPGNASTLGGFGARLMFNRSTPAATLRSFVERGTIGAFASYTGEQGSANASTLHYGAQGDVALFAAPVFRGVLDPFVSVGAGALRTSHDDARVRGRVVSTDFALTPGIGTRLQLVRGFGFRGDLRLPLVFGNSFTANPTAEGGVYLSF
jgi:hypothetical protein